MYLEEELQRQKIISSPTGNFSIRGILMCQRKPLRQNIITATRGNHCVTRRFFSNRRKLLLRCIGFAIEVSQGYFFVGKVKAFEFMEKMLIGRWDGNLRYAHITVPFPPRFAYLFQDHHYIATYVCVKKNLIDATNGWHGRVSLTSGYHRDAGACYYFWPRSNRREPEKWDGRCGIMQSHLYSTADAIQQMYAIL